MPPHRHHGAIQTMMLLASGALASCGPESSSPSTAKSHAEAASSPAAETRPAWAITAAQAEQLAASLDPRWSSPVTTTSHPDDLTGGESTTLFFKRGLVDVFTLADGRVWRLRLQSGIADRCGDSIDQTAVHRSLVQAGASGFAIAYAADCLKVVTASAG